MRTLIHTALIAGLVTAAIAPAAAKVETGQERLARLAAGRAPGKPTDCINIGLSSSNDSEKLPGLGMAYRRGMTWYINDFGGDCPGLRDDTILVVKSYGSQLCRGDIADLRMSGADIPVGSCVFGSFTPYTKP
jgi:hypothetical protein